MSITQRYGQRLGLGGTAAGLWHVDGRGFADETDGDPAYVGFARNIRVVEPRCRTCLQRGWRAARPSSQRVNCRSFT